MNEDIKVNPADRDQTPTWIENEHKVKSCWPAHLAKEMVRKNHGWGFTDADVVPTQKRYPVGGGELTQAGLQRRLAAEESMSVAKEQKEEEKVDMTELKVKAKRAGISRYWVKSDKRLLKELQDLGA